MRKIRLKQLNFRIDEELYFQVKELALKERRSVEELMNKQVEEYIKKHTNNPQYTIEEFQTPFQRLPDIHEISNWKEYLKTLSQEEIEKIHEALVLVDRAVNIYR